jgi:3-methyladenine DNA glycosylase AlkD
MSSGTANAFPGYKRGIPQAGILGTPKGFVTSAAKAIGKNQTLAEALWKTECHEARLVAILIADPAGIEIATAKRWSNELWSWDITDHMARYLLPYLPYQAKLITYCQGKNATFTRRLAFAGIACCVRVSGGSKDSISEYGDSIRAGANDDRHHVRKAVVWALVEIGKANDHCQEQAILLAADLMELGRNEAWVGRNAMKELQLLVSVPERKRLLSQKAKTASKHNQ